jgi:hypothetical protein
MNTNEPILLPQPARMSRSPRTVALPGRVQFTDGLPGLVREQARALCRGASGPDLILSIDASMNAPEAYRLACASDAIRLTGGSVAGVWYGLQTLGQLAASGEALPCVDILDTPDFPERGFMLDISRNKVPTMNSLFELVDLLSSLKINQLQLYTEHTFAFSGHELVWGDASPMTGAQVRELDAYCRDRYIELVPNLNSFGHMERWLRWPEYQHLAESPHGWNFNEHLSKESGTVLKPNAQSLAFVDSLYRELLPNFSSRKLNIGCDETWELGLGWSRPEAGKAGKHEVYLRFLLKLAEQVKAHGRTPQFWADILLSHPDSINRLPREMIPVIWGYEADHPFDEQCRIVAKSGLHYHVAPGTSTWKTLTGNLPNALANLRNAARNGLAHGARGYLITNWGDLGHHQTWPLTLPGLACGAALAWSVEANLETDIAPALQAFLLDDPSGRLSEAVLRAGSLGERFPGGGPDLPGRLFRIFFTPNANLSHHLGPLRPDALAEVEAELEDIRALVTASDASGKKGGQIREELLLNIDMARFAVHRGRTWLNSIEEGTPVPAADLRARLQDIVGRFESVWLARNRPGGLHDSSARMRKIMGELGPFPASIDYNPS